MTSSAHDDRSPQDENLDRLWNPEHEALWRAGLMGTNPKIRRGRRLRGLLPARDRCKNCNAPFTGIAALAMRVLGRGQYDRNPRFCDY